MSSYNLIWQVLFQFLLVVVLVFACVGVAVGAGLIVSGSRTLRWVHSLDRWFSTRSALKPIEIPRSTEQISHRYRRGVGWALVVGGLFASVGLIVQGGASAVGMVLGRGGMSLFATAVAESARWFLIVGSVAGVVVGLMLCFSPDAVATLERHANRWFSARRAFSRADKGPTLDALIEQHPRPAGWILACTGLGAVVYAALLLAARG